MGYTMLKIVDGVRYRYTEWVDFNTKHHLAPDWERVVGRELYNHSVRMGGRMGGWMDGDRVVQRGVCSMEKKGELDASMDGARRRVAVC